MSKKTLGILVLLSFLVLIFAFGIIAEARVRSYLNQQSYVDRKKVIEDLETEVFGDTDREKAKVLRVIDGDTIELEDKRRVRYIGVNAPEMTDKRAQVLCFAKMAKAKNQELVEGKTVELEKDVSDKDKYGRLLRYVWIDGKMINLELVKLGFARIATYPPDVKYKDLFVTAGKTAEKVTCPFSK